MDYFIPQKSPVTPSLADLTIRLPELSLRDERRLRRRLDAAGRQSDQAKQAVLLRGLGAELDTAAQRSGLRREALAALNPIDYPAELPVSARKDEIAHAINTHQVVIVAGETGSGKTTQLPKICAGLGRGIRGRIGHTQPRRLAAATVAERIAAELQVKLGEQVGYVVRHSDTISDETLIKVMTDGILLAETGRDRSLYAYDTIIIDEAHERSLNIDFLLGYLKRLLPQRPDLKLIITSATIDSEKFSRHFGGAPVLEVSGRTYPVELRYRPLTDPDEQIDRDQAQGICDAVNELTAEGPGDILVFLSGEREIRDTADALATMNLAATDVVPLFARLSVSDQHRVFREHSKRRIVLATNVAETSLTVPGVRYVIDAGTARISRFSNRTKVQRLPIEPISQASANQRAGRCGRVADGICIRLYSAADFEKRAAFTDPEIVRTNLASVILRMIAFGLGDIAAFPFLDSPDRRAVATGIALLTELGALEDPHDRSLTDIGRRLARLPVDPRFGRMILAAQQHDCVREVLIVVAGMSIQDPREQPVEHQQAAAAHHARFADPHSELIAYLNLWNHLSQSRRQLSSSRFRKLCKTEFLHYLRVREWEDVFAQLRHIATELGLTLNDEAAGPQQIHRAVLAGLLSHVGRYDSQKREYQGARGARFALPRGSSLSKKPPTWIMAAQLMETSRLWARSAASIEPEWIEPLAGHLVKRQYSEPHWSSKRAAVMGYERVTLYGLPIVTQRPVNYATVDAPLARELFIRHALVEGDWSTRHEFFHANRRLLAEVEELEERSRRRGLAAGEDVLFDFYDQRIGVDVVSGRHFDSWWKRVRRTEPELLTFDPELVRDPKADVDPDDFPLVWSTSSGTNVPMSYVFSPGDADDGVTVDVPLAALGELRSDGLAWQVPGLRHEIITTLLRSLPKPIRRGFVPIPGYVSTLLDKLPDEPGAVLREIAAELSAMSGTAIGEDAWDLDSLPSHLRTTFRVCGDGGGVLAEGKDLAELRLRLHDRVSEVLATTLANTAGVERSELRSWDFGELPQRVEHDRAGFRLTGFPALIDNGDSVAIEVLRSETEQRKAMWAGTRRLLRLVVPAPTKPVADQLGLREKLLLSSGPHRGAQDLLEDCASGAVDVLMAATLAPVWNESDFVELCDQIRTGLPDALKRVVHAVVAVLTAASELESELRTQPHASLSAALDDIRAQRDRLYYRGFVTETGLARLPDLARYLRAARHRLQKLTDAPYRDDELMVQLHQLEATYRNARATASPEAASRLDEVRWMLEELRVSYFAQTLGTKYPISEKRVLRALDAAMEV